MFNAGKSSLHVRVPRATAGTAMVETAIVLPLYMLILLGLLYFGYATLSRQGQVKAAAYAAWMPERQQADTLLGGFWSWAGTAAPMGAPDTETTSAMAWDRTLSLNAKELASQSDDYYGNEVVSQLASGAYSLGGRGEDIFARERLAVSLWTYALGEVTQHFEWVPGEGIREVPVVNWDAIARYLNVESPNGLRMGGAFVAASAANGPRPDADYVGWITTAINGSGPTHWLERRHAELDATFEPPFFQQIMREEGSAPGTFTQYVGGAYPGHVDAPSSRITFSLTGRSGSGRFAVGESGQDPDTWLQEVGNQLFSGTLPSTTEADDDVLTGGKTAKELWTPQ